MDIFGKLKMESAVKDMWDVLDEQIEVYKVIARYTKEYYKALLQEGFTVEQALELVKTQGISAGVESNKDS